MSLHPDQRVIANCHGICTDLPAFLSNLSKFENILENTLHSYISFLQQLSLSSLPPVYLVGTWQTWEIREKSNPCLCSESNMSRVSKRRWELHGLSHPWWKLLRSGTASSFKRRLLKLFGKISSRYSLSQHVGKVFGTDVTVLHLRQIFSLYLSKPFAEKPFFF